MTDSRLLVAAWKQALECESPDTPVVRIDDERVVTAREVLMLLRGEKLAPEATQAVAQHLTEVLREAIKTVLGRFSDGLRPTSRK